MRTPKARNVLAAVLLVLVLLALGLAIAQDQETLRVRVSLAAEDPRFPEYLARLLGHSLSSNDSYVVHADGPDAFPAMLDAIDRARLRIDLETYIYDRGEIGTRFTTALANAARRGVTVRIVLDAIGSKTVAREDVKRLQEAGCQVGWFNPIGRYTLEEANYRTHRKILAIDGAVAFVGGMGMADRWTKDMDGWKRWRDTQVKIRGPAALNVDAGFYENWIETGGVVEPDLVHSAESTAGTGRTLVVWSSPQGGANEMKLLYLMAIAAAQRTLDIQSPYLITDESSQWSLGEARKRGVRVRLLMEGGVTDARPVKFASRADYESLLAKGIELYEYQPAMMHTKALVVDGILSIVGSANFDNRSLELNDELNIAAFDRPLASRLLGDFDRDLTRSRRIDLESWRQRPLGERTHELMWGFFGEVF